VLAGGDPTQCEYRLINDFLIGHENPDLKFTAAKPERIPNGEIGVASAPRQST
jgi:hypothetical protein